MGVLTGLGWETGLPRGPVSLGSGPLSGHTSEKAEAPGGGSSSYGNVHQMADLKPRTTALEEVPLERWALQERGRGLLEMGGGGLAEGKSPLPQWDQKTVPV